MESGVYASFTFSGSLCGDVEFNSRVSGLPVVAYFVFQASCAALTFWRAVSRVNGGKGGLDSEEAILLCSRIWLDFECPVIYERDNTCLLTERPF